MTRLPFFTDPDTREAILDHISGYVFDRAVLAFSDEPMRTPFRYMTRDHDDNDVRPVRRSVRR